MSTFRVNTFGMVRTIFYILGGLAAALAGTAAVVVGPYYLEVRDCPADTTSGYYSDFYLYVSSAARDISRSGDTVTILVQPNNSGTNSDDPDVHRSDAWWMGFGRKGIAQDLGVVLLIPAFIRPAEDWRIYTHALDRDVLTTERPDLSRLDLQLLAMIDAARKRLAEEGIITDERILIQGFSASGMFANRFTALHPRRVKGVTAGSPGGWPIAPVVAWDGVQLPYPVGVADLRELTGQPFDSASYASIPQLIYMGSEDVNDGLDFRDGWEDEPAGLVDSLFGDTPLERWDKSRAIYRLAGSRAEFMLVEGVGHDRKALQDHSTRFLAGLLRRPR